jgi:hypothetical protein
LRATADCERDGPGLGYREEQKPSRQQHLQVLHGIPFCDYRFRDPGGYPNSQLACRYAKGIPTGTY